MQRISVGTSFYAKPVFAFVMLVFGVLFVGMPFATRTEPLLPTVLSAIAFLLFAYFIAKKQIFDLVDEVWDDGDALIIRNKGREDRIPLSAIMNVSHSHLIRVPMRVTLTLRTPSIFGDTIIFAAPMAAGPIVEDLFRRIDDARRRAQ